MAFKKILKERTEEEQATVLAGYLPNDQLWLDKNVDNSPLRGILLGLASQWIDFRNSGNELCEQYDPTTTTSLIEEWEAFVGIPDHCFDNTGSLELRRKNILLKLAGINATTAKQFEDIAAILGFDVTVEPGADSPSSTFPMTFPFLLVDPDDAPFVIIVNIDDPGTEGFPYTFPFTLSSGVSELLQCLFDKLKPANTIVYFNNS
jgi:uncharacterized protein YmfQ (DUF2313 family)